MEKLLDILKELYPEIEFENEKKLIENGVLDSLMVLNIISEIENAFDVAIDMEYIQPKYFESVECMWAMIEELQ